jgi:AcrR family transcriptional regulator
LKPFTKPVAETSDGRRRRSIDSRARIVAAMLDIVREGQVAPGAEEVAERAEVGLRTVFRHFKDMDSLYREIAHAVEAEFIKIVSKPFKAEAWQDRVLELIERRTPVYERITPFRRASDAHRHTSAFIQARHGFLAVQAREILVRILPADVVKDTPTFETLDLLLSFETWSRLRGEQGLSQKRAREVLTDAVQRVLAGRAA